MTQLLPSSIAISTSFLFIMSDYFDKFTNANSLYQAFLDSRRESHWKGSVQKFEKYILTNIFDLQKELRCGTYKPMPFTEFLLRERGKTRRIKATNIRDRIVQRSLCDTVLNPCLCPSLIYDNGASLKGKGIDFTRRRLQCHLEKFIRKHGKNGYILKIDFSKFFDNIDHELVLQAIGRKIDDPRVMALLERLIDSFAIDVSDLSADEIAEFDHRPIDLVKHHESGKSEKFLHRSIGIGSQISQIIGIYFPTPIDFHCKVRRQCKFYGRYMDDIYVIHEDKAFLEQLLSEIKEIATDLKLFINPKKTTIMPLRSGFTFMQVRYSISETGKIVKRLKGEAFTRERRRLKTYRRLLDEGRITRADARNFYQSFRGTAKKFAAYRSIRNLDQLYTELFVNN